MFKFASMFILAIALAVFAAGCGGSGNSEDNRREVDRVVGKNTQTVSSTKYEKMIYLSKEDRKEAEAEGEKVYFVELSTCSERQEVEDLDGDGENENGCDTYELQVTKAVYDEAGIGDLVDVDKRVVFKKFEELYASERK